MAIAIGLFGIAASFSAQVLARRKEFGLLAHLGLTRGADPRRGRRRRRGLDAASAPCSAWRSASRSALVLVKVVNPQSFHWTMDLLLPLPLIATLLLALLGAAALTAAIAGRHATARSAVLAVREDF